MALPAELETLERPCCALPATSCAPSFALLAPELAALAAWDVVEAVRLCSAHLDWRTASRGRRADVMMDEGVRWGWRSQWQRLGRVLSILPGPGSFGELRSFRASRSRVLALSSRISSHNRIWGWKINRHHITIWIRTNSCHDRQNLGKHQHRGWKPQCLRVAHARSPSLLLWTRTEEPGRPRVSESVKEIKMRQQEQMRAHNCGTTLATREHRQRRSR